MLSNHAHNYYVQYAKCFVLVMLLVYTSGGSLAQSVNAVSGEAIQDSLLIIAGSGFGEKQQVSPITWDDVESGSFSNLWQSSNQLSIGSEARHSNSNYCGTANMAGSGGVNLAYFTVDNSAVAETWFVQYWFMIDENFDWGTSTYGNGDENLANVKFFRMWNPGSIDENFLINLHGWDNSAQYYAEYVSNSSGGYCESGFLTGWETGVWHCVQFEYMDSSVGGNDGIFRYWRDGQLIVNDTDLMTRDTYSDLKRPYIVGFYDAWNDSGTDRDDFYIDDVYTDSTWARVELGNNSVFANCTHREIQIPTAWATDEITVTFNQGSFADGDTAYLFVVDADGDVSDGEMVIIGASSGGSLEGLSASVTTGTMSGSWTTDGAASWTVEAIPASGRSYSIWTESASFSFPVGATAYDVLVTSEDGPTATTSTGG
jgi:hypothetical protein